jgi:CdiI immunity protein
MTRKKLSVLNQLPGSYFHPDWLDEFESDDSALRSITESEPAMRLVAGVNEIDLVLAAALPEEELRAVLVNELGCYFDPASKRLSSEQWLKHVRERFAQG